MPTAPSFPTEPLVIEQDDGSRLWLSPPILMEKSAQRYAALRYQDADGTTCTETWVEQAVGQKGYASREAWAAAIYANAPDGRGHFTRTANRFPAVDLTLAWWRAMVLFLYEGEAQLEERLAEVDEFVEEYHSEKAKRRRKMIRNEARFGRIEHGDMMILKRPVNCKPLGEVQAFVMLRNSIGALMPHVHQRDSEGKDHLHPVWIKRVNTVDYMKLGPEALEVADNLPAHEKLRLVKLACHMRALIDAGQEKILLSSA